MLGLSHTLRVLHSADTDETADVGHLTLYTCPEYIDEECEGCLGPENLTTPIVQHSEIEASRQSVSSRASSVGSQQSVRGRSGFRKVFSRKSSTGYEEFVFDSRSDRSGSQASVRSNASCASGRRGPLSEWARAGMNAVKKIGACWRCKL
jgi:hypothetical protein